MYAEKGPRVNHVNTLSFITLQNAIPDVRNESRKQSRIIFMSCHYSNKMCALCY